MNIVFWSPVSGHGATTSNMACLSVMSSLMYCYKTIAFQSGYSHNNLNQSFIKNSINEVNTVNEEFSYYVGKGIDGILGSVFLETFTKESIADYCVEIVKGLSYYIPSTAKNSEELFNERMQSKIDKLLRLCNEAYDLTFIDNQSKDNEILKKVFDHADMCVINLSQNPEMITIVKSEFEKLNCNCKVFFVIGRYDDDSKYSVKDIAKKLHIAKEDIGVIPYCSKFLEAVIGGGTKEFLKDNFECSRKSENYYFISEVKKLTNKLLKKAGVVVEK